MDEKAVVFTKISSRSTLYILLPPLSQKKSAAGIDTQHRVRVFFEWPRNSKPAANCEEMIGFRHYFGELTVCNQNSHRVTDPDGSW